jgi:Zn-dependent protease
VPLAGDAALLLQQLVLTIPAILLAITFHEVAHGWTADKLGDPTARLAGRLTLNPLAHLDPIGALMLIVAKFGWAKPVPVNPYNLRRPLRDMVWVAAAGPTANFLLAALSLVVFRWSAGFELPFVSLPFRELCRWSYIINLNLAAFNLIPIPPLDGSQILKGFLPRGALLSYERFEPYGFIVLVLFLMSGASGIVLGPLVDILGFGLRILVAPLL